MTKKFHQKMLSNMELAEFCNQMGMILRSGISALEGLNLLLEDAENDAEQALLEKMITELETSGYFYEAISSSGVFPSYAFHMIKLGEKTGTLDEILDVLSEHYIREENLAGMIKSSLTYPFIMLAMMALVVVILLTKVLPIFHQVFEQLGQEMNGFSAALLTLGETLSNYSVIFILLSILIILLIVLSRKHLPFYQMIRHQMAACRFTDGMAIALKSGMTPEQGFDLVEHLVENPDFEEKIRDCRALLEDGMDFSAALSKSHILSGTYARMASVAGKAGTMDEAMSKISAEYEYAVSTKINHIISMIEPTLVIILSVIVGVILFSVMLPLLGIMSGL